MNTPLPRTAPPAPLQPVHPPATGLSRRTLALLAGAAASGALLGLALDAPVSGALLALSLALALSWLVQLRQLRQLHAWLQAPDSAAPPRHGLAATLAQALSARLQTEREHARQTRQTLQDFHCAAMNFPAPLALIESGSNRLHWFNRAAARTLGLRRPGDLGQPLRILLEHPQAGPWLRAGQPEPLSLTSPLDPSIQLQLRLASFSPQQNLLVAQDITQLTRLEQVRRDLVANASHELRTPLTVIHGYLDLLSPEDAPVLAPILPEMRNQSQRMTRIVEDLLTLSRLEAQQELDEERVAMAAMLESLKREAQALSRGQHSIQCEDALQMDLSGSPADLHSAFSNLVSNAVRYTPAGGRINIRFERHGEGARLAVNDTGHGIPAAHIPRLAERFYRVSTSRSRERGGTGLGLSIVKHVLHLHQARLSIESEVGHGSTFACHFGPERLLPLPSTQDRQPP